MSNGNQRATKRTMMKQEIKDMALEMKISMNTLKKWFKLKGKRLSLKEKLGLLNNTKGD